ncbi:MAG: carbon storage regulator [Planctomycetota bacterium]
MSRFACKRLLGEGLEIGGNVKVTVGEIKTAFRSGAGQPEVKLIVEAPEEVRINRSEREDPGPKPVNLATLTKLGFERTQAFLPGTIMLRCCGDGNTVLVELPQGGSSPLRWWLDMSPLHIPKGGLTMARVNQLFILIGRSLRK